MQSNTTILSFRHTLELDSSEILQRKCSQSGDSGKSERLRCPHQNRIAQYYKRDQIISSFYSGVMKWGFERVSESRHLLAKVKQSALIHRWLENIQLLPTMTNNRSPPPNTQGVQNFPPWASKVIQNALKINGSP